VQIVGTFYVSCGAFTALRVPRFISPARVWRWAKSKGSRSSTLIGIVGVWAIAFFSRAEWLVVGAMATVFA
jgi:hypothetical protein